MQKKKRLKIVDIFSKIYDNDNDYIAIKTTCRRVDVLSVPFTEVSFSRSFDICYRKFVTLKPYCFFYGV